MRALLTLLLMLLVACGGGDVNGVEGGGRVATVEVNVPSLTLGVGSTTVLQVTARDASGNVVSGRSVVWSSSDPTVAEVSSGGTVTAVRTGTAQIAASVDGRSAVTTVTVAQRAVASVQLSAASTNLLVGGRVQLTARTLDDAGGTLTGRRVTWSSSDPLVATIDTTGLVVGIAPGVVSITATSEDRRATLGLNVALVPVAVVSLSTETDTIVVGQSTQLVATPRDSVGGALAGRTLSWSSSDVSVASVGSTGLVLGIAPGAVTVTASTGGRSGTARVVVRPRPVASVIISPAQLALNVGSSTRLTVQVTDENGAVLPNRTVAFRSANVAIATVANDGTVQGVSSGVTTIIASSEGREGQVEVTVTPVPVAAVRITPATTSLVIGDSTRLVAIATDADGATLTGRTVVWSSGAPAVATVDASGRVHAVAPGSAVILATVEGRLATADVQVRAVPVGAVTVSPATASVIVGESVDLTATARDASGTILTGRTTLWQSSDERIAVVSSAGRVRSIATGSVRITASVDGLSGSADVVVTPEPVTEVRVSPSSVSLALGGTAQLTATPYGRSGPLQRPVSYATTSATVATVSASGLITAVAIGRADIVVTSEGRSVTVPVTVTPVAVATISVTLASGSLAIGGSTRATATLRDAAGNTLTDRAVTWSSSAPTVATVSADGTVQAVGAGTATISASSEGKTGSASLTVQPPPVSTVSVTLDNASLAVGGTTQARATLRDATGTELSGRTVTWSSSNALVATVSANGVVTALLPGTASITATSEGKSGSAALTVTVVPAASVTVTLADPTLSVGQSTTATAVVRDAQGQTLSGRTVAWSSSNTAVATVSASGSVTAVGTGSASITATSEGRSGSASVTVSQVPVATVTVALGASSLSVGGTTTATATLRDANGTALTGRTVSWTSSNPLVATVSPTGAVTALLPGSTTITATSEGRSGTATLTVTLVPVGSVTVSIADPTLVVGATTTATAVVKDAQGTTLTGRTVTWSSSNTNVATVSASGGVTAVGAGSASITATSDGKSGSASVTVTLAPVATVTVALGTSSLPVGATTPATATLRDASGTVLTGRAISWSSSNTNVARVSAGGVVTAVAAGSASIAATSEGKSGSASVTVTPPPVATVTVALGSSSIVEGSGTTATATLRDASNTVLTGRTVTWSSSAPSVATVSASGAISAVQAGTTTITATSEGKSGSATLTVTVVPAARVVVSPSSAVIYVNGAETGRSVQLTATVYDANNRVLTGRTVTWRAGNTVVTVDATGRVTAAREGNTTVTATVEGRSDSASISVQRKANEALDPPGGAP